MITVSPVERYNESALTPLSYQTSRRTVTTRTCDRRVSRDQRSKSDRIAKLSEFAVANNLIENQMLACTIG